MRTRSFQEYLEKRLSKEEIADIEEQAKLEIAALRKCSLDHTPNAETIKAIEDAQKGIGLRYAKDAKDLFKQLGIKIKKNKHQ